MRLYKFILAFLLAFGLSAPAFAQVVSQAGKGSVTINDPTTPTQKAAVNASGQLSITCANCSGSGASAVDESTFTQGTNSLAPSGGLFKTSYTNLTSGQVGIFQMTTDGALFTNLWKVGGSLFTLGQNTMANSLPVTFASNQSTLNVNCASGCAAAGDTTGSTSTLNALNTTATVTMAGENAASLAFTSSTSPVLTVVAECSVDGGTTYSGTVGFVTSAGVYASSIANPANGTYALVPPPGCAGSTNIRVRASAYTSGSVVAQLRSEANSPFSNPALAAIGASSYPNAGVALVAQDSVTPTTSRAVTATANGVKVDGSAVTQPVSGTVTVTQSTASNLKVDLSGTAANATAIKVDGSGVTQPVSGTVTANIGTTNGLALDASVTGLEVAQASTTSGQKGVLVQGAVTTSAPSYTTAQTSPLSLTTAGALRTDASATTQPVSGTVTANAGTGTFNIQANASVNVAQVAGNTVSTAATGTQKVGVVGNAGAAFDAATAAAPPANVIQIGGLASGATGGLMLPITVCDKDAVVNISTATTTLIVTGVASRKVYICSLNLVTAAANNVALIEGTTTTNPCDTGAAGMAGGTTAASGWNFAANTGLSQGSGLGSVMTTATNADNVCLVTSAATQLSGHIKYTIY